MAFYQSKQKRPAIVIVPLIDILAILLIFFILTTTFKKPVPQLEIDLPNSKTAQERAAESPPILLTITAKKQILFDDQPVTLEDLAVKLEKFQEEPTGRTLAMRADEAVPFGLIIQVIDILKQVGIENLPTFTEPNAPATP